MSQPPMVPGEEPQYQPPPTPVYQVNQPQRQSDVVGKSVTGTITVVATLFIIFCVAPMFLCVGCGALGQMLGG